MRIGDILKEKQPKQFKEIREKSQKDKLSYLTERDIKYLMGHSSYRRGPNGAIRQVRQE